MCGRFTVTLSPEEISQAFGVPLDPSAYAPRYNIAPSQDVLAVLHTGTGMGAEFLHWGFIPFWAKDASVGNRMINARSETLTSKKTFAVPLQKSRCLIVADGFYEWKKAGKQKVPFYFHLEAHRPFGFAGLWSSWTGPDGRTVRSCTIITTEPNEIVSGVHHRMPVILQDRDHDLWLDPGIANTGVLTAMLKPYPSSDMACYEVSPWVNNPVHEGIKCLEKTA